MLGAVRTAASGKLVLEAGDSICEVPGCEVPTSLALSPDALRSGTCKQAASAAHDVMQHLLQDCTRLSAVACSACASWLHLKLQQPACSMGRHAHTQQHADAGLPVSSSAQNGSHGQHARWACLELSGTRVELAIGFCCPGCDLGHFPSRLLVEFCCGARCLGSPGGCVWLQRFGICWQCCCCCWVGSECTGSCKSCCLGCRGGLLGWRCWLCWPGWQAEVRGIWLQPGLLGLCMAPALSGSHAEIDDLTERKPCMLPDPCP